jgi:hypothetical protein
VSLHIGDVEMESTTFCDNRTGVELVELMELRKSSSRPDFFLYPLQRTPN